MRPQRELLPSNQSVKFTKRQRLHNAVRH